MATHSRYWTTCETPGCASTTGEVAVESLEDLDKLTKHLGWGYWVDRPESSTCDWGEFHDVCPACLATRPDLAALCQRTAELT